MAIRQRVVVILVAAVALLPAIINLGAIGARLLSIDDNSLLIAPQVQGGLSLASVRNSFTPGTSVDYYPIRDLSYAVDASLFGTDWALYRLHQLALFGALAILVFLLLRTLGARASVALAACAVWAAHPIHAETLNWLSARKDVLALLLGTAAALAFVRGAARRSAGLLSLSCCFLLLAVLSKASVALLPLAAAVALFVRPGLRSRGALAATAAGTAIGVFSLAFQAWYYSGVTDMRIAYDASYRIQASAAALGKMSAGLLVPSFNVVDVENWGAWLDLNRAFVVPGFALWAAALLFAAAAARKRRAAALVLVAAGVALYAPVSGLLFPHRNFYSTRYFEPLFLLLTVGAALALERALRARPGIERALLPSAILLCTALGAAAVREADVWGDPLRVWEKALADQPGSVSLWIKKYLELDALPVSDPEFRERRAEMPGLGSKIAARCDSGEAAIQRSCSYYWLTLWSKGDTAMLERAIGAMRSAGLDRTHYDRLRLFGALASGKEDRELMASWRAAARWHPSASERILSWIVTCSLDGEAAGKATLDGYFRKGLVFPAMATSFVSQFVHERHWEKLKLCFP